jgi:hypothetical protein
VCRSLRAELVAADSPVIGVTVRVARTTRRLRYMCTSGLDAFALRGYAVVTDALR